MSLSPSQSGWRIWTFATAFIMYDLVHKVLTFCCFTSLKWFHPPPPFRVLETSSKKKSYLMVSLYAIACFLQRDLHPFLPPTHCLTLRRRRLSPLCPSSRSMSVSVGLRRPKLHLLVVVFFVTHKHPVVAEGVPGGLCRLHGHPT